MSRRLTTEEFIIKARGVHGDKYDYSRVIYTNNKSKIEIICPDHGSFWQIPSSHLIGKGCPECADNCTNYSPTSYGEAHKQSHIYVVKMQDENFYKIGIAKNGHKQRFSGKQLPYSYTCLRQYKLSGYHARKLEIKLHKYHNQ